MWYVYIIEKHKKLYTGITTNLTNRLRQHKDPKLLHKESLPDRISAAKRERRIKGWSKERKLKLVNLIK